jgi:G3E family GTPase
MTDHHRSLVPVVLLTGRLGAGEREAMEGKSHGAGGRFSSRCSFVESRFPVIAGKTTLLRRILTENHGLRIAVVENEFAESVGIESLILKQDVGGPIADGFFELSNGCLCCTQRDGLVDTLQRILRLKRSYDLILIETSGLADPGPVAASFWTDLGEEAELALDRVITVVDSVNFLKDLNRVREDGAVNETSKQVCFADSILLNKMDLLLASAAPSASASASTAESAIGAAAADHLEVLKSTIAGLNPTAEVLTCTRCDVPLRSFLLDDLIGRTTGTTALEGKTDDASMANKMLTGLGRKLEEAGLLTKKTESGKAEPDTAGGEAAAAVHSHDSRVGSFVWWQSPREAKKTDHAHSGASCSHPSCDHKEHSNHGDAAIATGSLSPLDYSRFQQWLGIVLWEKRVPTVREDFPDRGDAGSVGGCGDASTAVVPFDVFRVKGAVWLKGGPEMDEDTAPTTTEARPLTSADGSACCYLVQGVHDLFDCQPVLVASASSSSSSSAAAASLAISASASATAEVPEIARKGALVFIGEGLHDHSPVASALEKSLLDCCRAL